MLPSVSFPLCVADRVLLTAAVAQHPEKLSDCTSQVQVITKTHPQNGLSQKHVDFHTVVTGLANLGLSLLSQELLPSLSP